MIKLNYSRTKKYLIENIKKNKGILVKTLIKELKDSHYKFFSDHKLENARKVLGDHWSFDLTKCIITDLKVPPQENSQLPTINHKNFFIEFLADLRLCNRSIKRTIKNHDDLKGTYKYYTEEGLSRSWLFPSSKQPIIDIHKLSKGAKPVRTDEVKGLGSYRTVYNIITQIKDLINEKLNKIDKTTREIKDSDIASWIKLGMHGKLSDKLQYFSIIKTSSPWLIENILKDLTRIIYLMFGCEVMRNPAALIYNGAVER